MSLAPVQIARLVLAGAVVLGGAGWWASTRVEPEQVLVAAGIDDEPVAADTLPVIAPAVPAYEVADWLNTEPLTVADLRGRVVLYDFWTFGCYNCANTLPYVKAWHERYAADGLVVLSVHSPEFDYERDPANVAAYVEREHITYPVALDPDHDVWRAFGNHWWPAFYLFDRDGQQRYFHKGEGRYDVTEDTIRVLLGVAPDAPRAVVES